jgi:error-prone DNA polymerase
VRRDVFAENYAVARHAKLILVKGKLERQGEVIHVVVDTLARLTLPGGEEPKAQSRDFH